MGFLVRKDCVCYKYLKLKALSAGGGLAACMHAIPVQSVCVCYKYLKRLLLLRIPEENAMHLLLVENAMHRPHTLVA
jgi:hypothetical protein